ncbi:uncharacterized protein LACBIDRAFT_333755 [Laccaria bicolor S238N-H82]|uniref:Predicted protein n=1 Tax=Laccaria bicolor (strain S238N-H82 / ATCC MYA-4686) TaxID=486041 RepID=B0DWZ0_LACBS|nr:uncharacterized protein LACBIDRAFT_333755 [Laccaria bicolor S238N-H82]EDR00896.1 predicted protein [Laccaria bicolor S238N-H82]|eukprot:XP_001888490.1 predicted protein [Laccaria bicolor S238N-H82]
MAYLHLVRLWLKRTLPNRKTYVNFWFGTCSMWDNFAGRSIGKLADLDVFFREKIPGEQLTTIFALIFAAHRHKYSHDVQLVKGCEQYETPLASISIGSPKWVDVTLETGEGTVGGWAQAWVTTRTTFFDIQKLRRLQRARMD